MKIHYFFALAALIAAPFAAMAEPSESEVPAPEKAALFEVGDAPRVDASEIVNIGFDARIDYQHDWIDGNTVDDNSGFKAKYINLHLDGTIIPGLTYSWRQRFNRINKDENFFDSTDWLYLNYDIDRWSFNVGKQVVMIGGYEYDRAPINLYSCSVFWNNVPCYDLGVWIGYSITPNDKLKFQAIQSPFFSFEGNNRNMYGYNLFWEGNHGWYKSLWSANLLEYRPGKYINYLALGNRFEYDRFAIELDLMNRASSHQTFFFKDFSLMAELSYQPGSRWNVFAKYTYDVNKSGTGADLLVLNGTELNMIGAGVEFYPIKQKKTSLRLHANCFYAWGKNTSDYGMRNKNTILDFGITWYMNILKVRR